MPKDDQQEKPARVMRPGKHPVTGEPAGMLLSGGKKHGPHLSTILREELDKAYEGGSDVARDFIQKCIKHANDGSAAHAKLIFDRIDGPTKEEIDLNIGVSKVVIDL